MHRAVLDEPLPKEQVYRIVTVLRVPPDLVPIGRALIAKPAPDPDADLGTPRLAARRRPLEEVVRWNRW